MDADTLADYMNVDSLADLDGLDDLAVLGALGSDELGARYSAQRQMAIARTRGRPPMAPGSQGGPMSMPLRQLQPQTIGVPQRGLRKTWLPLGAIAFVNAGATTLNMVAQSQRPFRGTRLVFDFTRTGATATGLLTLTQIVVGQDNQPAAQGAAPLGAFGPNAFDVDIDLDPTGPGINFTATVVISAAPGVGDRVDVSAVLFGYNIK